MNFKIVLECIPFERNSWLLGLPTTFMFVEEDLNNSLLEPSLSCHELN